MLCILFLPDARMNASTHNHRKHALEHPVWSDGQNGVHAIPARRQDECIHPQPPDSSHEHTVWSGGQDT